MAIEIVTEGTIVMVTSTYGFEAGRILAVRCFVGADHEARAKAWGSKQDAATYEERAAVSVEYLDADIEGAS